MKKIYEVGSLMLPILSVLLLAVHLVLELSIAGQLCLMVSVLGVAYQSNCRRRQLRVLNLKQAINAHANRETRVKSPKSGCFPTITVS